MAKLVIQIPCYNEEGRLAQTLARLPRSVAGFERVEWLMVDDGSRDRTVEVARLAGVDHIVCLPHNQGLARAFMAGIEASLESRCRRDRQYRCRQSVRCCGYPCIG